jgi:hypothetical protein
MDGYMTKIAETFFRRKRRGEKDRVQSLPMRLKLQFTPSPVHSRCTCAREASRPRLRRILTGRPPSPCGRSVSRPLGLSSRLRRGNGNRDSPQGRDKVAQQGSPGRSCSRVISAVYFFSIPFFSHSLSIRRIFAC